jgi:predicted phage-related endonuclease
MSTTHQEQTRAEFLKERLGAVGGSEIAHVVMEGDYACSRKLFFDKTQVKPDFDDSNKPAFRRGRRLEPVAAQYYADETGRILSPVNRIVSKTHPHCAINADRMLYKPGETEPGYLEIKTVKSTFPIRKKGLYKSYILQVQFGLAVTGWNWGAFAVYQPLDDELLKWDFEADKELGTALLDAGEKWWNDHIVKNVAPPILDAARNKPCEDCKYRVTCPAFDSDEIIL